ncbi:epoxide hydrolase family protein [Chryseobacterium populi]|uniref:Putative hydrolase or acyltransferase of alpha/beta superfamily n=1 Tax=Chryseobacterium populi TaxID=1144316 RepID=J2JK70_9FLAO|nr:epoxide hydrolase family protein [Chryseobacterium populi]EJL68290.1 putative hydrolase or acyltransferase of alpha/beta superfamily [Chryseobacterium populi]
MKPFTVNISEEVISDLKNRIQSTRWPGEPEGSDWHFGTSEKYLKNLTDYWLNEYDWKKYEEQLNQYPQYLADVDGIQIHFQHIKGKGKSSKPLILTHGWPDSFYRFHKIIHLLTDGDQSFDLIIPSIPGFGFSGKAAVSSEAVADLWVTLMTETLGYKKFYAAGGDVGMSVTKALASKYPDIVEAVHFTDIGYPMGQEDPNSMTEEEKNFAQFVQQWWYSEGAYAMIHSTKPQSLAYALNDSPVGLAAWILSFGNAGAPPELIEEAFGGKDELLTNIMIYWVTQTISSSMRMYKMDAIAQWGGSQPLQKTSVPAGLAVFPREAQFPREWAERFVNVVSFKKMESGGHFAALEVPQIFADELLSFFYSLE